MVEMTDEEYNAYETRQKAFQESEQGQKELKEHAEWKRKREAEEEEESRSNTINEPIEGGKNDPIENTNSSLGMEPIREVAETAVEEHANLKQAKKMGKARAMFHEAEQQRYEEKQKYATERRKKRDEEEPDAYMTEVYRKRAEKEQKEKTTKEVYAALDKEMAESFFGGKTKAQVEAEMPAGSRGKYGTVGTKPLETNTHPEAAAVRNEHFEATVAKAKSLEEKRQRGSDRVKQDLGLPTSREPKPVTNTPWEHNTSDPFAAMNADIAMGYGKPTPDRNEGRTYTPYTGTYRKESINAEVFDMMNADTAAQATGNIDFGGVNAGGSKADELAAKKKQIADYQKTAPRPNYAQGSMEKDAEAKQRENRDKKTLEEYKTNRSSVGKVMDLFSREHAQEIGYAAEKKVEAHLRERRAVKEIEAKKKTEPLLIQNDLNLKEGKITEAMHADRERKYLDKMERMSTPIEQKVGGAVKREANSTFDILNEVMTSPEARNKINAQRVKEGKAPITSAMKENTIAATFARGLASTNEQLHTRPPKPQPSIFSGATVEPKFSGQEMHRLPTSSSFYGVVPSARQPRGTKGAKGKASPSAQKSGSQINFGGSAPISFGGGGYGLFGNSRPAPAPAPQPQKQPRKKR